MGPKLSCYTGHPQQPGSERREPSRGRLSALLEARRDVVFLRSQWPTVEYVDEYGQIHSHTFDHYIELDDGTRVAIPVRPTDRAQPILDMIKLMRTQSCELWDLVDDVVLFTNDETENGPAYNARQILWLDAGGTATKLKHFAS